jgi:ribonuclease P protein component
MAARLSLLPLGTDLVVRTNPAAATASSAELGADLDGVLTRILARLGQRREETTR